MGERVSGVRIDFKRQYPGVPWQDIADTRNKLIHEYFGVDLDLVWNIIQNDLPLFKEQIKKMVA